MLIYSVRSRRAGSLVKQEDVQLNIDLDNFIKNHLSHLTDKTGVTFATNLHHHKTQTASRFLI
uniref:Uncharacterized protein n=1 Tax=Candidatus Nitrotoga fabula TaxID=2182327 RepID=A0A2X0R6Y6_9PROT|nr:protein of unknown function [Candidatus Nitrotoga fabula]